MAELCPNCGTREVGEGDGVVNDKYGNADIWCGFCVESSGDALPCLTCKDVQYDISKVSECPKCGREL